MRFFLTAIFSLWTSLAYAENTAPQSVISDQIAAFQTDDYDRAFGFAAPTIRQLFGTAQNFGRMVEQGFPMVRRPRSVEFVEQWDLSAQGQGIVQRVELTDPSGLTHLLDYQMIQLEDGWFINGVVIVPPPGVTA